VAVDAIGRRCAVTLAQLLFSQGFGTRRECAGLIASGRVAIGGEVCTDASRDIEPRGIEFTVGGEPWTYRERALLVMHKPAGHECSQKPRHHPSVYALLPAPLRRRGVQAIGRLDEDTTGVLLFTDDGALIHRLTSPRHHVPKVYEVGCRHPVDTVRAAACEATGPAALRLTLLEGKYHQVKRMVAAAGNRVESLARSEFGGVRIDALAPGAWRWLNDEETAAVTRKRIPADAP
jgi:16S rRNA pseudouridine516 synthase